MSMLMFLGSSPAPASGATANVPGIASTFSQLPLAFVPNQGQSDPAIHFEVHGVGNQLTFAPQAITLQVQEQTVQLNFIDANPAPTITAGDSLPGIVNYFQGNQADSWLTNISTYAAIHYQELYPGINLRYEGNDGLLESTFTLAPGADPALIRWQYTGASAIAVDEATGDLLVTLPDQSQVVEQAPLAWQEIDGQHVPVAVAFAAAADNSVSFVLPQGYNPALPLTIDPTIVYETTLDLGEFDNGLDITTDSDGNAYVLARVYDDNNDVLIAKLSPAGDLLYTTYLRGSKGDFGGGIALDNSGDVYVAGGTDSDDFPILNAMHSEKLGTPRDAFIAKLAGGNGDLLFSTFYGGGRSDIINDITLNDNGEIYVVGFTESTDFPTVNPIQDGLNLNQCFCEDTFVSRLSPDALSVLYSTYLGGSFEDYGQSIALDGSDNIYITGRTQSDDFPTQAAIQPNRAGENQDNDLFVSKIAADGSSLVYSTYLGGTNDDSVRRIAVDSAGNAFVAGSTSSENFPTTAGAYEENYIGGVDDCGTPGFGGPVNCPDMFVTKLTPDGSNLAYSTYLGGGLEDVANGIAINDDDEAFVVGYTSSEDFPGVTRTGPGSEIAIAKLSANGSDLLYTVIIDSAVANAGHGIDVDDGGDVYITGAQNAPSDLYVAKIADDGAPPPPPPTDTPVPTPTNTPVPPTPTNTPVPPTPTNTPEPANQSPVAQASANPNSGVAPLAVQFSAAGSSDPDGTIAGYAWDFGDGATSTETDPAHTYDNPGVYQASLTVTDDEGASASAGVTVTVNEATQNEIHVQEQRVTRQSLRRFARGIDRVLVTDQNNQPVAGVLVTVTYSGPSQGQVSRMTGSDGRAILRTNIVRNARGEWCFEITSLSKDGYLYNPPANVVTTQCESN